MAERRGVWPTSVPAPKTRTASIPIAIWRSHHHKTGDETPEAGLTRRLAKIREACLSNKTALAIIFKLAEAAEKSWRRLDGHNQLPKVILGVKFTDGIEVVRSQAQAAA
jgi:putative transposase